MNPSSVVIYGQVPRELGRSILRQSRTVERWNKLAAQCICSYANGQGVDSPRGTSDLKELAKLAPTPPPSCKRSLLTMEFALSANPQNAQSRQSRSHYCTLGLSRLSRLSFPQPPHSRTIITMTRTSYLRHSAAAAALLVLGFTP